MISLWLLLSALGGTCGLVLLRRLNRERAIVRRTLAARDRASRLPGLVERLLDDAIDGDLLAETGPGGLAEITLRFREPHDRSRTVSELLGRIAQLAETRSSPEMIQLVKHLYQLQHALQLPPDVLDGCLQDVVRRLLSGNYLGSPITRVAIIREGEILDRRSMWPLSPGTRVKQAFGVALFGESDKVLDKAKVICR